MLRFFKEYREKQEFRRDFLFLFTEGKSNLEQYYVMFQLGRLRFFSLDAWEKIGSRLDIAWDKAVQEYIRRLAQYNRVLKEYKDFQFWYNDDLERKNQENGRLLHKKKELAQEQFAGLEEIIKAAVASLQEESVRRKFIKPTVLAN